VLRSCAGGDSSRHAARPSPAGVAPNDGREVAVSHGTAVMTLIIDDEGLASRRLEKTMAAGMPVVASDPDLQRVPRFVRATLVDPLSDERDPNRNTPSL